MKHPFRMSLLVLAIISALPLYAQTVTTPPRTISSQQETPGVDSTFHGNVQPNASNSTITLSIPSAPSPPSPPPSSPPVTCTAGSSTSTVTQTASCLAGYMTISGSLTFTQTATQTVTTTCPSGSYGAPSTSTSTGAWSPTPSSACPTPTFNWMPFNGQSYGNRLGVPVIYNGKVPSGMASLVFYASTSGWEVSKAGWLMPSTVIASGSIPTGAVNVSYTVGTISQGGDKPVGASNSAPSSTSLTTGGTAVGLYTSAVRGNTGLTSMGAAQITVYFYNAAGAVVGQGTFWFSVGVSGSA